MSAEYLHHWWMNKKIVSWALYDSANSVFFTTVMAGFFPLFFKKYWSGEASAILSTQRLGLALALSGLLLAILSPTLGIISDKRRLKKKLLFGAMILGAGATVGLYFVPEGGWSTAALLYGVALFFASASCVFYDSLLPAVATREQYDYVSALGFSFGYLGGGLLFLLNVLMYLNPHWFGISSAVEAIKISFVTVAVVWFLLTLPLMRHVPEPALEVSSSNLLQLTRETFSGLGQTVCAIFADKNLFYFVLAYWLYIDGIFTVMTMAVDFGLSLGLEPSDLIKALLITQFIGFPSAYMFGVWASKWSNRNLILLCLAVYLVAIIGASQMSTGTHFFILATVIGLVQGGVQALSRSLFAQLSPVEKSGEYFGFFNLLGKFASVIGPALIAFFAYFTGDSRQTILSLLLLVGAGGIVLLKVQKPGRAKV